MLQDVGCECGCVWQSLRQGKHFLCFTTLECQWRWCRTSAEHREAPALLPKPGGTCCFAAGLKDHPQPLGWRWWAQVVPYNTAKERLPHGCSCQPSRSCLCWPLPACLWRFGVAGVFLARFELCSRLILLFQRRWTLNPTAMGLSLACSVSGASSFQILSSYPSVKLGMWMVYLS